MTWHTWTIASVVYTVDTAVVVIAVVAVDVAAASDADAGVCVCVFFGVAAVAFVSAVDAVFAVPVVAVEKRKGQGEGASFLLLVWPSAGGCGQRKEQR